MSYEFLLVVCLLNSKKSFLSRPLLKISNLNIQSILIHRFRISESFSLKFVYNTKIILVTLVQSRTYAEHQYVCSQCHFLNCLVFAFLGRSCLSFLVLFSSVSCPEKFLYLCCKASLVVLNSVTFSLSVKVLISPLNLNQGLTG